MSKGKLTWQGLWLFLGLLTAGLLALPAGADDAADKAKGGKDKAEAEKKAEAAAPDKVDPEAAAKAAAEAAVERRFARQQLLRRAREGVDPSSREAGGLEELKNAVETKREALAGVPEATEMLARTDVLLGRGEGAEGLIRQGGILYRWISDQGEKPVRLLFRDPKHAREGTLPFEQAPDLKPEQLDVWNSRLLEWRLDVDRRADNTILLDGIDGLRAAARNGKNRAITGPEELVAFICQAFVSARSQQVSARVAAFETDRPSKGLVSAGTLEKKAQRAAQFRETAARYVSLRQGVFDALDAMVADERELKGKAGKLVAEIEEAKGKLADLSKPEPKPEAPKEPPPEDGAAPKDGDAKPKDGDAKPKDADETPKPGPKAGDEKPKQPDGTEEPGEPKLTEAEIEAAAKAAAEAAAKAAAEAEAKAAAEAEAKAAAEAQAKIDAEAKAQAIAKATGVLELLRLQEVLAEQELRLLYIAVRRADLRISLYDQALEQVKTESVAADKVQAAYENELTRMRRELQIDRLAEEKRKLESLHAISHPKADGSAKVDPELWTAYDKLLKELIAVNTATTRVVKLRRRLERMANPEGAGGLRDVSEKAAELPPPPPAADVPVTGEGFEGENDIPGESEFVLPPGCLPPPPPDPLRRFRNPTAATLDVNYVRDAEEAVAFPEWDAGLAADHYEAVDDRILGLKGAATLVGDTSGLQAEFAEASAAAETALKEVKRLQSGSNVWWEWRDRAHELREEVLKPDVAAFGETIKGIDLAKAKITEDLVAYRSFRDRLVHLGVRSFSIRVQRRLETKRLMEAKGDLVSTVVRVKNWLTMEGEPNLWTFLKSNWLLVLVCVGVLVGSILLVRFGRHGLDHLIRSTASKVPQLRTEPVTVKAEEAQAKRTQAQGEAAAKAAEEAALAEVSKGEAAKTIKMGEGGYGGGAA